MPLISKESPTLGGRLKKRRETLGWSIEDISREISITPKYIRAFEEDDYDILPARVYALGFLRKVLTALAFEHPEEFVKEFGNEWEVRHYHAPKELKPLPQNRGLEPYLTPRSLGIGIAVLFFVLFVGYLGFRMINFVDAPLLSIDEPDDKISVTRPVIQIKGRVEKESQLTVNGRGINVDEAGNFNEEFELAAGINALEFLVKDRFGKESRTIRHVLIK